LSTDYSLQASMMLAILFTVFCCVCRESESPASRVPAIGAPKAANITLEMLSSGGYYDMPMSVSTHPAPLRRYSR